MSVPPKGLWQLIRGNPYIDSGDLSRALVTQVDEPELDYRTRLLIRDSVNALKEYWGTGRLYDWLYKCPARHKIESICSEDFEEEIGFPSIKVRLMDKLEPDDVRELFRNLGGKLRRPVRINVGGAIALIMPGLLARNTDDIDVINEVPEEIRNLHSELDEYQKLYGLHFGHVQSHYFPSGWDKRLHYLDSYDELTVYLVDPYDVFLSKLFSRRTKDMGDMRVLMPQLDKNVLSQRFRDTCGSFLASDELKKLAEQNWYILFGEKLPS
jgi:hypothetical protein